MPVIIDELVVSVNADQTSEASSSSSNIDRKALVEECVERVMDILERKIDR